jgi:hypothetical protein
MKPMNPKTRLSLSAAAAAVLLAACGAKPDPTQVSRKVDQRPSAGADVAFAAPGWKAGDATSWEQQVRARAQAQNEYARMRPAGK